MFSDDIPLIELAPPDTSKAATWYVVFTDYECDIRDIKSPKWIFWPTRPGFRHVLLLGPAAAGGTLCVNMMAQNIGFDWFPFHAHNCALSCAIVGRTVLQTQTQASMVWRPRGIITCVSLAKAVLGISAWRVLTPFQLYQHLLRRGASPIVAGNI